MLRQTDVIQDTIFEEKREALDGDDIMTKHGWQR
jgi:hypothetical protein